MNTKQLQCALDSDPAMKDYSRNVFALDQFHRVNLSDKGIFECNDQPSKKSGNHWFLIFIDPEKIYFVDSFANEPKYYHVDEKLRTLKKPIFRFSKMLQSPFSTLCGEYCIFFAYHLSRNFNLEYVIRFFTNDCVQNDQNVKDFIWRKFPGHERDSTNIFWNDQNKL